MVKKKIVKAVKKVKAVKPINAPKPLKLKASGFEDQVKSVLSHLLDLFKASLIDAFRQYVESKIKAGAHASMDDFTRHFQHTIAAHGIQEETLLASLDDVELEYLDNCLKTPGVAQPAAQPVGTIAQGKKAESTAKLATPVETPKAEKEAPTKGVFDSLDLI